MIASTALIRSVVADSVQTLLDIASGPLFAEKVATGTPAPSLVAFRSALAQLPEIEVVPDKVLQGELGAFSAQVGKIYLSESLVNGDGGILRAVLMKEIERYLDSVFNGENATGHEGTILAAAPAEYGRQGDGLPQRVGQSVATAGEAETLNPLGSPNVLSGSSTGEIDSVSNNALWEDIHPLQCGCSVCGLGNWNTEHFSDPITSEMTETAPLPSTGFNLAGSYSNVTSQEVNEISLVSGLNNPVEISNALGATWMRDQFPGTSSESIGDHSALYMRVTFPDINRGPNTLADAMADMADNSLFYIGNSRGIMTVSPTYTPVITLPFSYNWLSTFDQQVNGLSMLQEAAKDQARNLGFNPDNYNVNIVRVDLGLRAGASWGGGNSVWLAWGGFDVIAHEAGHALGIGHAGSVDWSGNVVEYGNQFDQMGGGRRL